MLTAIEPGSQEATLVRAAQSGDRVAFGALYEQYGRMVHGVVLAHVAFHEAEDLMQDVFVKAMERLPSLRQPAAFGGWLMAIARRAATDHQRSKRPVTTLENSSPGGVAADSEPFEVLARIQGLPESYRETLILRLVEGMTGPEIAARTGLTPDSVRVNLCRGMKMLRISLEQSGKT